MYRGVVYKIKQKMRTKRSRYTVTETLIIERVIMMYCRYVSQNVWKRCDKCIAWTVSNVRSKRII